MKHTHVVLENCWLVLVGGKHAVIPRPLLSTEIPTPAYVRVAQWLRSLSVDHRIFAVIVAATAATAAAITLRLCRDGL